MNKDTRKIVTHLIEALESDNTTAVRQIGREFALNPEALLYHTLEAAGVVYATHKEPSRSDFFDSLLIVGKELDSEAVAWGILERTRRDNLKESKKTTKSFFS